MTARIKPRPIAVIPGLGTSGRLGNQLVQICTTIAMAERYGTTPRVHDDWRYRHVYNLSDDWYASPVERGLCTPVESLPEMADLNGPLLDYLQDLRWWEPSMPTIRHVLTLKPEAQARVDRIWDLCFAGLPQPYGVCHVRRGDNVTNDPGTINCLPKSYYREGMEQFPGVESWLMFSDDPDWCRHTFGSKVAAVYDGVPRSKERAPEYATETVLDWIDLALMCRAVTAGVPVVLSNSSYALMVAVLSAAVRVVYPSYWYGQATVDMGGRPELLFPPWLASSWIRLDVADPNPLKAAT